MRQLLYKLAAILAIVTSFAAGWLLMEYRGFVNAPLRLGDTAMRYTVESGATLNAVARDLQARGVLDKPRYLVWLAHWQGTADHIKAGEYELRPGIKPLDLLHMIAAGRVIQYALTLVEGWTFRQVMDAVNSDENLVHTLYGLNDEQVMEKLGWSGRHPEGRFYPDTYYFNKGTSDAAFLQRAYRAMEQRLAREWQDRVAGLPYRLPYEALILASIVEKETALPSERKTIAGVMVRRLQKGMRLQVDPTVIYGMGASFDGNIRRRDLNVDTPYNTYRHAGLPPTPIAMPGGSAIRAALRPEPGDALYFVARGDGSHHFSATLEEHNQAVIKYQLGGRKRPFSSLPAGKEPVSEAPAANAGSQ